MTSSVSICSIFRQASLNDRHQRASIFIDRKYMVLVIDVFIICSFRNWFRKRDLRGQTQREEKNDQDSVVHVSNANRWHTRAEEHFLARNPNSGPHKRDRRTSTNSSATRPI